MTSSCTYTQQSHAALTHTFHLRDPQSVLSRYPSANPSSRSRISYWSALSLDAKIKTCEEEIRKVGRQIADLYLRNSLINMAILQTDSIVTVHAASPCSVFAECFSFLEITPGVIDFARLFRVENGVFSHMPGLSLILSQFAETNSVWNDNTVWFRV